MPTRVTLRQIAKETGYSLSTVSLVLRGNPRFPAETRDSILAVAERLGYERDPALSAFAQQRWQHTGDFQGNVIAFVNNFPPQAITAPHTGIWPNLSPRRQTEGVMEAARKHGYKVEVFNMMAYPNGRALGRVLHQRGIKGVLLAPFYHPVKEPLLEYDKFSIVSMGRGHFPTPFHTVESGCFEQIMYALERIVALGYRDIGVVLLRHSLSLVDDELREGACFAARHRWASKRVKIRLLIQSDEYTEEEFTTLYQRWWKRWQPECILGFTKSFMYRLTIGPCLKCPDDFRFANLHIDESNPNLAGLRQNDVVRGNYGVSLLDMLLRGNITGIPTHPILHQVGYEWQDGYSLPAIIR